MALTTTAARSSADGINKAAEDVKDRAEEKCIRHYRSTQKILLVGEGDFSFSKCLAQAFGSGNNMIATSLNSIDEVLAYSRARENLQKLEELGCTTLHEVDALSMTDHPSLVSHKFDKIIFNFPHAGFCGLRDEREWLQIELHRELVDGFFKSASRMLNEGGEVHVTHKTSYPFNLWSIERLAMQNGLQLLKRAMFGKLDYPGYNNKRGDGKRFDQSFPIGQCITYMFTKTDPAPNGQQTWRYDNDRMSFIYATIAGNRVDPLHHLPIIFRPLP